VELERCRLDTNAFQGEEDPKKEIRPERKKPDQIAEPRKYWSDIDALQNKEEQREGVKAIREELGRFIDQIDSDSPVDCRLLNALFIDRIKEYRQLFIEKNPARFIRTPVIEVPVDIEHGGINVSSKIGDIILVSILSTDGFDAATINHETVTLTSSIIKGESTDVFIVKDVNEDGKIDLLVYLEITDIRHNEINTETSVEVSIEGVDVEGSLIKGTCLIEIES
jgi:hypothetical protein